MSETGGAPRSTHSMPHGPTGGRDPTGSVGPERERETSKKTSRSRRLFFLGLSRTFLFPPLTFAPSSYFCTVPLSPGLPMFYLDSLVRRPRQAAFSGERTGHLRALTAMKISAILQYIEFSLIWTESYFMSRNKFHMTEWRPSA